MGIDLAALIAAGRLAPGDELYHQGRPGSREIIARVTRDGIEVDGTLYMSLSTAAARLSGHPTNGWTYWRLRVTGRPIDGLRRS